MYTYIKYNIKNKYVEFPDALDPELYNNLGTTYQDYVDGKWVLLSEEQLKFKEENPSASVREVFDMQLTPKVEYVRTLEDAIREKNALITKYDSSNEVNLFYVKDVPIWLDKATRTGLKLRFEAEAASGQTETTLWYGSMQFPLTVEMAIQMLYAIELYASACYDNTQRHLASVAALSTIEEVDNYDYTIDYPEKLRF